MKKNNKKFLTTMIDCTYGILKRYVAFLNLYVLLLGTLCLITIVYSDLFKNIECSKDILTIKNHIESGQHYGLTFAIYCMILIITAICRGIQLASRFYARPKEHYKIVTDFSEIGGVFLIICIKYSNSPVISLDHIFVMCIILGIYKLISQLLVKKSGLNLKYFKSECIYLSAPMGKATILSETTKKDTEELGDEKEETE